jgi:predicted HTH transcriptional regulator
MLKNIASETTKEQHIRHLIREGEHQQLDFKFEISDSKKIARTLAAFSNTDGGKLLIGVKDNGAIAGVRSEEEFFMLEGAATMYCKPPVALDYQKHEINGKSILEVTVPKDTEKLVSAPDKTGKYMVYIRVNDQNLLANTVLLRAWRQRHNKSGVFLKFTDKEKLLLEYLTKNEKITFSRFRRIAGISRKQAENILVKLVSLEILQIIFTEKITFYKLSENLPENSDWFNEDSA